MDTHDPMERLAAAYRVEVDEGTMTRHLAELGAALKTAPPAPIPTGFALRRRLAGALAAVFVVAAPVGMAVAAEDSVPGDVLYPVKQVTERVRAVFDDEIEATHRVEEVERLVFVRSPRAAITRAIERAESATLQLAEKDALVSRLESARRQLQQQDDEELRRREATDSRSREQDEADRRREAERQERDHQPGSQEGSGDGSGNSGANSQQSDQGGGSATTTSPAQSGRSGEGAGDPPTGGSTPGQSSEPRAGAETGAGGGEPIGESPGAPETERVGTPEDPGGDSGSTRSSSTTVP